MKKRLLSLFMAFVMVSGIMAGCGSPKGAEGEAASAQTGGEEQTEKEQAEDSVEEAAQDAAKAAPKELTKVTLSAQPALHSLGIYVALDKGWFEEEGLDVDVLTYIAGAPQLEAVASDSWSVGIMGIAAGVTGLVSYDLTCLGFSFWDYSSQKLYVRPDSEIALAGQGQIEGYESIYGTPELYKGKTILCTKGSLGHLQLLATLDALGLKEDDVNIVHMEIAAAYQAFLAGEGDAVCLWSTFSADGEGEGLIPASSCEAAKLFVPSVILASDKALADEETTQKIMNVIFRGTMWVNENREEAAQYYYDLCIDEGVTCTEEYARSYVQESDAPTVEEYRAMFEGDEFTANLEMAMKYYIACGTYSEADMDKVLNGFDGTMLMNAIEYYEENYAE